MPSLQVGLTGGIGSGKSTVAALLAQHPSVAVMDTDAIGRQLTQTGGAAIAALRQAFGDDAIDDMGAMNRAWVRERAFLDPSFRRRLEHILHPLIGAEVDRQAQQSGAAIQVFDVPLLVESGRWRPRLDSVLVIDCEEATQMARVTARSGWDEATVRAAMQSQASRAARLACADCVIYNDGIDMPELADTVTHLVSAWRERFRRTKALPVEQSLASPGP
jgi:dephospho-CoA kinase